MLTKLQFDVLSGLLEMTDSQCMHKLSSFSDEYREAIMELIHLDFIDDNGIKANGISALEQYRVKRAIFIAAGFGSRLAPITLNTPKPLINVNGRRLIDGLIDACLAVGIEELIVVRGYLSDLFDQLLKKYPMIKFVENPLYDQTNNISSAVLVRDLFSNAYVFEADLLLNNPKVITAYQYQSNFLGFKVDQTDDWCFTLKDDYIASFEQGGRDCYQGIGISYWTNEDGKKLSEDLKSFYEMPEGRNKLWDNVPLKTFADHYKVSIRECEPRDVIEIDTFEELKQIDQRYDVKRS